MTKRLMPPRTRAVLDEIQRNVDERGYPPTIRELRDALGISSCSVVSYHLDKLESLGLIRREPSRPRAIQIIGGPA